MFYWKLLWKNVEGLYPSAYTVSFNPCSIGNCSGRLAIVEYYLQSKRFQSLFYWKLLWKLRQRLTVRRCTECFNPCSIGNCSGSRFQILHSYRRLRFQSLFYWKLLWKNIHPNRRCVFLPVSILVLLEIALEERFLGQTDWELWKFQSLFYGTN